MKVGPGARLGVLVLIAATALLLSAFHVFPSSSHVASEAGEAVSLPVLVYPDDGRSQHVETVTVSASDVSQVDSLYFQMHQPYYHVGGNQEIDEANGFDVEGAASIRVNGGAWVAVRDANVDCAYPESRYDCVAGTVSTIRFTVPAGASGALVNGANTVDFRFNGTDGIRSGYRVLGLGFMRPSDPDARDFDAYDGDGNGDGMADGAIDGTSFVWDDPAAWSGPSGGDAASGAGLWSERGLLTDGTGAAMTASCADCHFADGRDLAYFAFSNRSIVSRSRFHGLSDQQGRDIAAYIRSQALRTEDGRTYDAPGRPWAPPFQPGPEMLGSGQHPDVGDPVYFLAGAGLEWVLDHEREDPGTERDVLAHMFPKNGDPAQGIDYYESGPYAGDLNWHHLHTDSLMDLRAIPQAQQFPDWNNWLPDAHPVDFWPGYTSTAAYSYLNGEYRDLMDNRDIADISRALGTLRNKMRDLGWPKAIDRSDLAGSPSLNEEAIAQLSTTQLRATIAVESYFKHHLWTVAGDQNCGRAGSANENWSFCEPVAGPGSAWVLFEMGPHVNGTFEEQPYGYGDRDRSARMTHLWYELALVVASHPYLPSGGSTLDWNYQHAFMPGGTLPLTNILSLATQAQAQSNAYGNNPEESTKLVRSWSAGGVKQEFLDRSLELPAYSYLDAETTGKLLEAYWRAWWNETSKYDPATFPRDDATDGRKFDNESYGPEPHEYAPQFEYRTRFYWQWSDLAKNFPNEMAGLVDSMTTWGGTMWPLGNDPDFMGQFGDYSLWKNIIDYSPPASGSQSVELRSGWNLISARYQPDDTDFAAVVSGTTDLVIAKDQDGRAYIPSQGIDDIGTWSTDEGYQVYVETAQTMTVDGTRLDRTTPITLEAGWNLLPYYPEEALDVSTALAGIGSPLVMVKDYAGNAFLPDFGIDDIGTLDPGQGYKVYVSSDVTFSYPEASTASTNIARPGSRPAAPSADRPDPGVASSATLVVRLPDAGSSAEIEAATRSGELLDRASPQNGVVALALPRDAAMTPAVDEGATPGDRIQLRYRTRGEPPRSLAIRRVRDGYTGNAVDDGLRYRSESFYVVDARAPTPLRYRLIGNTPNPADRQTTIEYALPEDAAVTLELYNVLGQRVATLVDTHQNAGRHRVRADLSRLGSGAYVYRLEAGDFTESRKMTIVR